MHFFRSYPFIRLLSFQLTGIGIANFSPGLEKLLFLLFPALLLWLAILIRQKKYPFDLVHSGTLAVLIIMISFMNVHSQQDRGFQVQYGLRSFEARVLSKPLEKANSFQAVVCILQCDSPALKLRKLIVYLEKDHKARGIRPGDLIVARSVLNEIRNSGNPFEFDYRNYMSRKQIRHSSYIPADHYRVVPEDTPPLRMAAKRLQAKLISELKKKFSSDAAFQIVSALTLGYRDELTKETRSYFTATGAMHILAVSGLHVGMIFIFLKTVLFFLHRSTAGKTLKLIVVASFLWGYALLTGFSPSVQRAAVMFSFILIGNSLSRPSSLYNSIAGSAFLLLFFKPDLIFDAGFQLSYVAVISIVFFYPKLTPLLKTRHPVLNSAWKLICVSVAAQLGTFPLSLFYFNQFPVYFWLSNLFVVPAASVILVLTGLFFILLPVEPASSFIARILCITADYTLIILKRIGNFPFAVIDNQYVSIVQFFCLLLALALFMAFIAYKRHLFFFTAMLFLLLFQVTGLIKKVRLFDQEKLIIYHTGTEQRLIHLINGRTNYLITESPGAPNPYLYQNVLLNLRLNQPLILQLNSTDEISYHDLIIRPPVVQFSDKSLILTPVRQDEIEAGKLLSFSQGLLDLKQTNLHLIRLQDDRKKKIATGFAGR